MLLLSNSIAISAQEHSFDASKAILLESDTIAAPQLTATDTAQIAASLADTLVQKKHKRDWAHWQPKPKTATWLAIFLPGAGQIYNRKFWKLPIVYGGFVGCIYALRWNNTMYKDYAQAYLDIMDDDPGTASYNKLLHLGRTIDSTNEDRYKQIFKSRKDRFRRWRDLSFFCMVAVYAISVIDAYVDAELSEFDISKDLSLKVEPTVFTRSKSNNAFSNPAVGLQCSLKF